MVREASTQLLEALATGGYKRTWVADLMYNGSRRQANLPLLNPRFAWDGTAQIQASGQCDVAWSDVYATSIVPRQIGDPFSPFGAELQVDVLIGAGVFTERLPMGRFVLDSVPEAVENVITTAGAKDIVLSSLLSLELKDYFLRVQRDRFPYPTAPSATTVWSEAFALTGLPVLRSTTDVAIPAGIAYGEDRLDALGDIFAVVDAWPHLTPSGQLTGRPKTWPAASGTFGGAISAPRVMESDSVYNRVDVEGKALDGSVVRAFAEITEGFLRVRNSDGSRSPLGMRSYKHRSDFLTTSDQCLAAATTILPRVSRLRSVTRVVVEPFMPVREVGDVLWLPGRTRDDDDLVRIQSVTHDQTTTRSVVEVSDT